MSSSCASCGIPRRSWATLLALLLTGGLATCGGGAGHREPVTVFDADVALTRGDHRDEARREITIDAPTTIVAIVDERGTDVTLHLAPAGSVAPPPNGSVVETNLEGEGLEVATLDLPKAGTLVISLDGPRASIDPGKVKLRILRFDAAAAGDTISGEQLRAWRAWSRGTRAGIAAESVKAETLPQIDDAIRIWEHGPAADAKLAAQGRWLRARTIYFHEIDWLEARAEAEHAASAFSAPGVLDSRSAARARLVAAASLLEVSFDATARAPTASEADVEMRRMADQLSRPDSGLDEIGIGRAFNLLGLADLFAHQWSQARVSFDAAVLHYDKAGYRAGALQSRRNLALLATYRGDLPIAAQLFTACISDVQWIDEPDLRSSLYTNAGTAAAEVGDSDTAIARFIQAERIGQENGLPRARARALQGLGVEYFERGDLSQASSFLQEALALRRQANDAQGLFGSLRVVGTLQRLSGNLDAARQSHQESLERATNPVMRMRAQVELALDEAAAGRHSEAVTHLRRALGEQLENIQHPAMAEARVALADQLLSSDSTASTTGEARRLATQALDIGLKIQDLPIEMNARRVLARIEMAAGQPARARAQLERAIALALNYRRFSSSDELRASALANQHQVFQDYIALLMDGALGRGSTHRATASELQALNVLESARAQMFSARRSTKGPAGKINEALVTLAAKRASIATLLERAAPPRAEIETLQNDSAAIRAQIDRLRSESPERGADAVTPALAALDAVTAEPGRAQVSYLLGATHSYAWERSAQGTRVWILPARASEVDARIRELTDFDRVQDPGGFDTRLLALSNLLMPEGLGGKKSTSLDIVADGALTRFPFAGLRSPTDPTRRLIETHIVRMLPSLAQRPLDAAHTRRWHVVALSGTKALPSAEAEAREIAASASASQVLMLEGSETSVAQLERAYADGADVIHVAAHGRADADQPLASRLAMGSGYVTAGQIQEWHGDVGLVFLSACDTAVGLSRFGDSTPGLQRAFLRAGTHDVVATLWPIEDRLASAFAREFYASWNAGVSPAEALAHAQRAWISSSGGDSLQMSERKRVAAWAYAMYSR